MIRTALKTRVRLFLTIGFMAIFYLILYCVNSPFFNPTIEIVPLLEEFAAAPTILAESQFHSPEGGAESPE